MARLTRTFPSFISAAPSHLKKTSKPPSQQAMAEGDHCRGPAKNLLEPPGSATAATSDVDGEGDFTFALPPPAGDDVFPEGRIGPVYPIFGQPRSPPPETEAEPETVRVPLGLLLLEERSSSARSKEEDDKELDGVLPDTYCIWTPGSRAPVSESPARCRKSGSTGSVLRWRRVGERLIGRSHSDGKEKFVFLNTSSVHNGKTGSEGGGGHVWSYYAKGRGRGGGNGSRRSSFLPYKQELVGLFANVSRLRRSYHPF